MAQGKMKKSALKLPSGAKKSSHKKPLGPQEATMLQFLFGSRPIAPKKTKAIENQKFKKNFDRTMKVAIEKECTARAENAEAKSLMILKTGEKRGASKPNAKGDAKT